MREILPENIYSVSSDLISREIEDTLVIVPLDSGIGKLDEDIYALNGTGKAVWDLIDGENSLETIMQKLAEKYHSDPETIKEDVIELIADLLDKGIIFEIRKT